MDFVGLVTRAPLVGKYVLLLMKERRDLSASVDLLAHELRFNVESVDAYLTGNSAMQSLRERLDLSVWESKRFQLQAIERGDADVWREITNVYACLTRTRLQGATPPDGARLRALADRLDQFRY